MTLSQTPEEAAAHQTRRSRPWSVTITAVAVFIIAVFYFTRVAAILRRWEFYDGVLLPYANVYLLLSGIVWSLAALILTVGLWTGRGWALPALKFGALLYILYDWVVRLVIGFTNAQVVNWPFILIVDLILILWLVWNFSRPTVKQFFGEEHEQ